MASSNTIQASDAINRICHELDYSRAHVAKALRDHHRKLKAKRRGRQWVLPAESEQLLKEIVQSGSGRRYKLGERGPHGSIADKEEAVS